MRILRSQLLIIESKKRKMPSGWAALRNSTGDDDYPFEEPKSGRSRSRGTSPDDAFDESPVVAFPVPDTYVLNVAPPLCGQGAPKTPNEFLNISVSCARKNPDATGKEVVWYDMMVRTTTHQWTVSKRFSDLIQFHQNLKKLKLERYKSEAFGSSVAQSADAVTRPNSNLSENLVGCKPFDWPPAFPSKFHLRGNHDPVLIEERRLQLDSFWKYVLKYLQLLTLAAIGVKKAYGPALRSAFSLVVDFLRSSSQSESTAPPLWAKDDPYSPGTDDPDSPQRTRTPNCPASPLSCSKSIFGGTPEGKGENPPCKIILDPGQRFTVVLFLPGVLLSDIYVDATSERDRSVVIGGRWNPQISGVEGLREQGVFTHSSSNANNTTARDDTSLRPASEESSRSPGRSGQASEGSERPQRTTRKLEKCVLMDTLPRGSFEMTFDVPSPFERAHWYSEYDGGVLLIMWNAP